MTNGDRASTRGTVLSGEASESAIGPTTDMELVIDESVLERSRTDYEGALQTAYDLDQFRLYLASEPLEFGVAIIDDVAWLGATPDSCESDQLPYRQRSAPSTPMMSPSMRS